MGICQALVYDDLDLIPNDLLWRLDLNKITFHAAVVFIFGFMFLFFIIDRILICLKPGIYEEFIDSIEDKRKINVYVASMIVSTVLQIISLIELFWKSSNLLTTTEFKITYNAWDDYDEFPYGMAICANIVVTFYCVELFYRFKVQWDLYLHHILAIVIIIT